ncbi:IclR family transcriptional regulator [Skermanella rosea]|uniref:IclR family transcriptional regulator n=1 Tax=Skermanella rosea TaxID=1817965 RepID=UPI001931A981|nr:IclR family transcriptional regulator [Skermanella rosea]UEM04619.1 IclR family transcriptional regulator [Skermanella rosea]
MNVNGNVKTAGRTLDVFEAFEDIGKPLTLSDLARRLEMPVSSCHGLVGTLKARGYLYAVNRRTLYPTRRILEMARRIVAKDPMLERMAAFLERLRDDTGETVILGKRQDDAVIYLDVVEGARTIRYSAEPGELKPLHSSAIGKAMLGEMAPADLAAWLAGHSLDAVTENTLVTAESLASDLAAGRQRGYHVTRGENVADVMAVATAIHLNGEPLGVAVAGPLERMKSGLAVHAERLLAMKTAVEAGEEHP